MISLIDQIQIGVISFFIGFLGSFFWDFFYNIFIKKRKIIGKILFSLLLFLSISILWFYLLLITTDAYLSMYLYLFLFLGIFLYFYIYHDYIFKYILKISKKIENRKIKIYNHLKQRWKYGKGRKGKKKHLECSKD